VDWIPFALLLPRQRSLNPGEDDSSNVPASAADKKFSIKDWYSVRVQLQGAEEIPNKFKRRNKYFEGMTVYVVSTEQLQQLLTHHGKYLPVGQKEAIKILLQIEDLHILSGDHQHHKHFIAEDGHPTNPDNLIHLSC
jgi:hypothetical protein